MSKSPNTTKSPTNTSPTRGIRGRRGPPRGRAPTRSRPMSQNIPNLRGNFRPNRITSRNPNSSLNTNQNTNTNPINKTEETNPNTKQKVANVFKSKFEEQKKIRFPQKKPIAKKQNNLPGKLNPNKLDPAKLMAQALMGSPKSIQKIHANKLKEEKKKAKKEKKIKSKEKNANENKTEKTQDQEEKLKPKKITEQEVEKMHVQTLTISTKSEETEPKQISETNKRGEDMYLLFKSEKEFLSQLETFLNNYQIPLSQSAEIANSNYAEKALVKVEPLIEQQKLIVDKLTSLMKENISINERSVGKCYSDFKTEVYEMWVDQYDEAMHNSTLLREEVAEASDLFHKCQEQCDNKNYDFFLAEPLRRINSLYQEIRTLLLHTDVEKQDYARLYNFLNKIEPVLYQTAPRLYVIEHQAELLALEETIENRGKIRIAQNGRYLHMKGTVLRETEEKPQTQKFFVFNDKLFICKKKKAKLYAFESDLAYTSFIIRDLPDDENGGTKNAIELLVDESIDRCIFTFKTSENKQLFITDLHEYMGVHIEVQKTVTAKDIVSKRIELSTTIQPKKQLDNISLPQAKETNQKMRANVIREMVQTEGIYVEDLNTLITHYLQPLRDNGIVNKNDVPFMFSFIEAIYRFNQELFESLKNSYPWDSQQDDELVSQLDVGKIFLNYVDYLKIYTQYCSNHPSAVNMVVKYNKNNHFEAHVQSKKENVPECKNLSLLDFLIKPIQRICKYPLLFRELLKNTSEDYSDRKNLVDAYLALERVADYVNERKRNAESAMVLVEINSNIQNIDKHIELVQPTRQFIQEANLKKKSAKKIQERHFWLFNDVLVYAQESRKKKKKKFQYKGHLFLAQALARDIPSQDPNTQSFQIYPFGSKKSYIIYFSNEEQKKDWFEKISHLIIKLNELGITAPTKK